MKKLYAGTSETFLKIAGGKMHIPSSYLPGSAPGNKLYKLSKEPNIFQLLGTISIVRSYCRVKKKGGGDGTVLPL